ncbi:transthyretin-like protein, putative [Candida dubliniensis CD36]|uniref:hydroxyisourate hydrolase n=1 Tax=Candida dubliniensis (strain CD36 / ATCC MYA-646 / CBS 7987 / NCPF 3949 / NRRL Y-17841) TaxID=573826 RepID=B9WCB6_CANDC|nr:transthyretin-like protein, putative [Candida dubliniensis CD36]CAX44038.1 transthyretin-like protein, putative [Candida dubliniensis CD36]
MSVDPITCHILDTTLGKPASGVIVQLFHISNDPSLSEDIQSYANDGGNKHFATAKTDNDGRIKQWIIDPNGDFQNLGINKSTNNVNQSWQILKPGIYKAKFLTGKYFLSLAQTQQQTSTGSGGRTFFPFVEISFIIDNPPDNHYHIPLLLSNYSYTTYRGS